MGDSEKSKKDFYEFIAPPLEEIKLNLACVGLLGEANRSTGQLTALRYCGAEEKSEKEVRGSKVVFLRRLLGNICCGKLF